MNKFDDIRPYNDGEIPPAMRRIAESEAFPLLSSWIFPNRKIQDVKEMMMSFKTIHDFQYNVMYYANERIIKRTISKLKFSGFENLVQGGNYLFVSNHRDIMLDASLLQNLLVDHGFETTEITFGANLMQGQLVIDIGKSNKMFKVERPGGSIREFYRSSLHLSEYIRHAITDKKESVWIAQRNGRTKDGNDKTDQGIIKMFCMSEPNNKIDALANLHIIPVSISYEWESCDILKAIELYESRFEKYIKKPGEDLTSILTGIRKWKGLVNIVLCPEVTHNDLNKFDYMTNNEYHRAVAELIDGRIVSSYELTPNNFIAHDIRFGRNQYQRCYTKEEYDRFLKHMDKLNDYDISEPDVLKDIFLGIYSNPIDNKIKRGKPLIINNNYSKYNH